MAKKTKKIWIKLFKSGEPPKYQDRCLQFYTQQHQAGSLMCDGQPDKIMTTHFKLQLRGLFSVYLCYIIISNPCVLHLECKLFCPLSPDGLQDGMTNNTKMCSQSPPGLTNMQRMHTLTWPDAEYLRNANTQTTHTQVDVNKAHRMVNRSLGLISAYTEMIEFQRRATVK